MNISAKKFKRKLKAVSIIFSSVLLFDAAVNAQSINDDLKPKSSVAKNKSVVKTSVKPAKKKSNRSAGKSSRTASVNNTRNYASTSETPDQIINRFMNFRQSAGVTNRDWKSVIVQTEKILKSNPNHSTAKAQSFIAQGQIALNQREFPMAINHFKSALQILPSSSLLHYSLGKAYLANGQAEAAERSFKEAIEQNEKFALAYKGLGDAFAAQGEKKSAAKYFQKATEIGVREGNMAP